MIHKYQNFILKIAKAMSVVILSLVLVFSSPIAMAQPVGPCVMDPPSICTRDINECGNASVCACPDGYEYSAAVGKCLVDDVALSDGPGVPVKSKCAEEPQGICTQDINACGNASICQCPDGYDYSPVVGQCIRDIGATY